MGPLARRVHRPGRPGELTAEGHPAAALKADRGRAAETDDFFRSRAFFDAERVSHTLLVESGQAKVALPVLVREVPGSGLLDAVSPYGYPGGAVRGARDQPPDPSAMDWSGVGLVSAFIRDRLGAPACLAGATARSTVQVHDPSRERRLRSRFAEQIRRNGRLGYEVEMVPGPESSLRARSSFHELYIETMERADAAPRYFFEPEYLAGVLGDRRSWLALCRAPDGGAAAGAIVARSDGLLHYYLGGTATTHLSRSPFKNVVDAMVGLSDSEGVALSLGGGVSPGDGLEDFKRGFANAELPFHTHEVVCDELAYRRLSAGCDEGSFFPAYRAPTADGD